MYSSTPIAPVQGEHRIYLSLAPGIGATRRLLADAQLLALEGYDIMISFRTASGMLEDFAPSIPLAPLLQQQTADGIIEALDLEAVLRDPPQVLILGNLAYQHGLPAAPIAPVAVVQQLREAGVAVWSTVYAFNLSTIAPIYQRLTGQPVEINIPEHVIDQANSVVLLDPTPDEIVRLLDEGVLLPEPEASLARETVFRADVLEQLRTATHALLEIHRPLNATNQRPIWMICIGFNPNTVSMLQRAADIAHSMGAVLLGLHVRPPGGGSSGYEVTMREHLEYAEELCHEVVVIEERDFASAMTQVATEYGISGIFLGRPVLSRWDELRGNSLLHKLINGDRSIDLFMLADAPTISH